MSPPELYQGPERIGSGLCLYLDGYKRLMAGYGAGFVPAFFCSI